VDVLVVREQLQIGKAFVEDAAFERLAIGEADGFARGRWLSLGDQQQ
jgi:hypothetical protein